MAEQLVVHRYYEEAEESGLSWPRIIGIAFVIALHLAALMLLLIPAVAPKAEAEQERNILVTLVDAPPPAPVADIGASVDISSKNMNPPRYPPAAARSGIEGEVILVIDVDANGNVTNVSVEKSSRNRDLDRAAMEAARKWRFNPSIVNGQKAAGRVRVPVNFTLG